MNTFPKKAWFLAVPLVLALGIGLLLIRSRSGPEPEAPETPAAKPPARPAPAAAGSTSTAGAAAPRHAKGSEAEAAALDTVSVRGLVQSYSECLQRGDEKNALTLRRAIQAKGTLAKSVIDQMVKEGWVPAQFHEQLKRDCDEIH